MEKDYTIIIDKYLNKELSPVEKALVEELLEVNPEFKRIYTLQKDLNESLSNKEVREFYLLIKEISKKQENSSD